MSTVHRNPQALTTLVLAFELGFRARLLGKSEQECQIQGEAPRQAWIRGFRKADQLKREEE